MARAWRPAVASRLTRTLGLGIQSLVVVALLECSCQFQFALRGKTARNVGAVPLQSRGELVSNSRAVRSAHVLRRSRYLPQSMTAASCSARLGCPVFVLTARHAHSGRHQLGCTNAQVWPCHLASRHLSGENLGIRFPRSCISNKLQVQVHSTSIGAPLPNPSLNRTRNGRTARAGRRYPVHFRQPALAVLPSRAG